MPFSVLPDHDISESINLYTPGSVWTQWTFLRIYTCVKALGVLLKFGLKRRQGSRCQKQVAIPSQIARQEFWPKLGVYMVFRTLRFATRVAGKQSSPLMVGLRQALAPFLKEGPTLAWAWTCGWKLSWNHYICIYTVYICIYTVYIDTELYLRYSRSKVRITTFPQYLPVFTIYFNSSYATISDPGPSPSFSGNHFCSAIVCSQCRSCLLRKLQGWTLLV